MAAANLVRHEWAQFALSLALRSDSLSHSEAQGEWERRLDSAGLDAEDWDDMTEQEARAVERILLPPPSNTANDKESYSFVSPNSFRMDDDHNDHTAEFNPETLYNHYYLQHSSADSSAHSSPPSMTFPPLPSTMRQTKRRFTQNSYVGPALTSPSDDEGLGFDNTDTDFDWSTNATFNAVLSTNGKPKSHKQQQQALSATRQKKPLTTTQQVQPRRDLQAEAESAFASFKLSLRIAKIREFHAEAAELDMDLAKRIAFLRTHKPSANDFDITKNNDHDETAETLLVSHREAIQSLLAKKEEERREQVKRERRVRRGSLPADTVPGGWPNSDLDDIDAQLESLDKTVDAITVANTRANGKAINSKAGRKAALAAEKASLAAEKAALANEKNALLAAEKVTSSSGGKSLFGMAWDMAWSSDSKAKEKELEEKAREMERERQVELEKERERERELELELQKAKELEEAEKAKELELQKAKELEAKNTPAASKAKGKKGKAAKGKATVVAPTPVAAPAVVEKQKEEVKVAPVVEKQKEEVKVEPASQVKPEPVQVKASVNDAKQTASGWGTPVTKETASKFASAWGTVTKDAPISNKNPRDAEPAKSMSTPSPQTFTTSIPSTPFSNGNHSNLASTAPSPSPSQTSDMEITERQFVLRERELAIREKEATIREMEVKLREREIALTFGVQSTPKNKQHGGIFSLSSSSSSNSSDEEDYFGEQAPNVNDSAESHQLSELERRFREEQERVHSSQSHSLPPPQHSLLPNVHERSQSQNTIRGGKVSASRRAGVNNMHMSDESVSFNLDQDVQRRFREEQKRAGHVHPTRETDIEKRFREEQEAMQRRAVVAAEMKPAVSSASTSIYNKSQPTPISTSSSMYSGYTTASSSASIYSPLSTSVSSVQDESDMERRFKEEQQRIAASSIAATSSSPWDMAANQSSTIRGKNLRRTSFSADNSAARIAVNGASTVKPSVLSRPNPVVLQATSSIGIPSSAASAKVIDHQQRFMEERRFKEEQRLALEKHAVSRGVDSSASKHQTELTPTTPTPNKTPARVTPVQETEMEKRFKEEQKRHAIAHQVKLPPSTAPSRAVSTSSSGNTSSSEGVPSQSEVEKHKRRFAEENKKREAALAQAQAQASNNDFERKTAEEQRAASELEAVEQAKAKTSNQVENEQRMYAAAQAKNRRKLSVDGLSTRGSDTPTPAARQGPTPTSKQDTNRLREEQAQEARNKERAKEAHLASQEEKFRLEQQRLAHELPTRLAGNGTPIDGRGSSMSSSTATLRAKHQHTRSKLVSFEQPEATPSAGVPAVLPQIWIPTAITTTSTVAKMSSSSKSAVAPTTVKDSSTTKEKESRPAFVSKDSASKLPPGVVWVPGQMSSASAAARSQSSSKHGVSSSSSKQHDHSSSHRRPTAEIETRGASSSKVTLDTTSASSSVARQVNKSSMAPPPVLPQQQVWISAASAAANSSLPGKKSDSAIASTVNPSSSRQPRPAPVAVQDNGKSRSRRLSDPTPPSPRNSMFDTTKAQPASTQKATPSTSTSSKSSKLTSSGKRVTIEEVSDDEADSKIPREHPTNANVILENANPPAAAILEPKPSVPPAMFDNIIQYQGKEVAPAPVVANSTAPSRSSSVDDWQSGESTDDQWEEVSALPASGIQEPGNGKKKRR